MRGRAQAVVVGEPSVVRAVLADLATWPDWLDVVLRAVPDTTAGAAEPAWRTRLGLRLGPLRPGYDVRLVRVVPEPAHLRFERQELDGRHDHSAVVLDVAIIPEGRGRARVDLDVRVDKRVPLLDLQRELDRRGPAAVRRLERLVAGYPGAP